MKIKQTILAFVFLIGTCAFLFSQVVFAANNTVTCGDSNVVLKDGQSCCSGVVTSIISCDSTSGSGVENTGLWSLLLNIINILSAGVGLAAVGGVVYGAVLYSASGGSSDGTKKAKEMFVNIGIGIVAYILMYSLLNYLIPGGLFN